MKQYMRDISEFPLLTPQEEIELADKIHVGDEEALNKMVRSNLRLVVTIAMELCNRGMSLDELVSEGNLGLIQAAQKFDPNKGAKFSTYASWWIKQAMRRALIENDKVIRIPTSSLRKIRKIKRLHHEMAEKLGREPTNVEIARNSEFSENVVGRLKGAELHTVSLQSPISNGEDDMMINLIPDNKTESPERQIIVEDMVAQIRRALPFLNEREQEIITCRFGLDGGQVQTLENISEKLGLTRERVRQIQNRALQKMRRAIIDAEEDGRRRITDEKRRRELTALNYG
jgi:RNA polymerase primary sigma factor